MTECKDHAHVAAVRLAEVCIAQRDAPLFKMLTKGERQDMGITAKHYDDALSQYRAARAAPAEDGFWCICSADPVKVDEDGCCATCGATAWTTTQVRDIARRASEPRP